MINKFTLLIVSLFTFTILSPSVFATATQIKPLSFGKIAVANNSQVSRVTISRFGQVSVTNNIYVVEAGSPGEIELSGYLPGSTLQINATIISTSVAAVGLVSTFNLVSVDTASSVSIGSSGTEVIRIGGVLETTGDNSTYFDGNFSTLVRLNIDF